MQKYYYKDFAKKGGYITINESVGMHGFEEHSHDFFEIVYIRKGYGDYEENGRKTLIYEGDLLLVTPKDIHSLKPVTGDFSWTNCLFLPAKLYENLSDDCTSAELLSLKCFFGGQINPDVLCDGILISKRAQEFQSITAEMTKEYFGGKDGFEEILKSLLSVLLIRIKRNLNRNSENETKYFTKEQLIGAVDKFMTESNALPPLRLETAAASIGLKPKYFSDIFKKKVGISFSEYVRDKRLNTAAWLLRTSDANIISVMEYIGYHDSKTFYKLFKEKFGETPSVYRKITKTNKNKH